MQNAFEILHLLSDGKFHSGECLAKQLKISRSSVWKAIDYLRHLEVTLHAVKSRGYCWVDPIELLNKEKIFTYLNTFSVESLSKLDVLNVTASTNDYLLARIPHGLQSGSVCIAEGQTAGRGRQGKSWSSPVGANIYLSFYWRFTGKLSALSGLSLIVALAILDGLSHVGNLPTGLGIKWPNDIWYQDKKLCGILIETVGSDVIIGIGLNVQLPRSTARDRTDLKSAFNELPSRNKLIAYLLNELFLSLKLFEAEGFPAFAHQWQRHDLLANQRVQVSDVHSTELGVAQGVNERGELLVRMGENLKAIRYGDVSIRPD